MKKIAVIGDLPSGGGSTVFNYQTKALKRKYEVNMYFENNSSRKIKGIVNYYITVFHDIWKNIKLSKEINRNNSLLVAYQSWLTKSPIIFPLIKIPIIYICNEVPREHYDKFLRETHTIKEMIINNILLIPIRIIDYLNIALSRNNLSIITLSQKSSELIKKTYRIIPRIIYPGISDIKYSNNLSINNRKNQIITVGAINKYKNQYFVLKVVSKIPERYRPIVVLVGNGGDSEYIRKLEEFAKIHNIILDIKININSKELIKTYSESKALMYSPVNEPFGLVVIEAMMAGLPLIVSKNGGGYTEIINKNNGYILENEPKLWANTYTSLILDPLEWSKYSNYNIKYAKKYTDIKSTSNLIKHIESII